MALTTLDKHTIVFHEDRFQQTVPSQESSNHRKHENIFHVSPEEFST